MNARKCDRCGKYHEYYNMGNNPNKPNGVVFGSIGTERRYYQYGFMDLCPECMKAMGEFMAAGKKEENT